MISKWQRLWFNCGRPLQFEGFPVPKMFPIGHQLVVSVFDILGCCKRCMVEIYLIFFPGLYGPYLKINTVSEQGNNYRNEFTATAAKYRTSGTDQWSDYFMNWRTEISTVSNWMAFLLEYIINMQLKITPRLIRSHGVIPTSYMSPTLKSVKGYEWSYTLFSKLVLQCINWLELK